jgi:tetratricopeptide (TPR) repeat protein
MTPIKLLLLALLLGFNSLAYAQDITTNDLLSKARDASKNKNYTQAVSFLSDAVKQAPNDAELLNEYGLVLFKAGQLTLAEKTIQNAIMNMNSDQQEGIAYYNLGRVYEEQGLKQQAIRAYTKSLRLKNDHTVKQRLDRLNGVNKNGQGGESVMPLTGQVATQIEPPCNIRMLMHEVGELNGEPPVGAVVIGSGKYATMKRGNVSNWSINWIDSQSKDQISPPPLTFDQALKMGVRKHNNSYRVILNPGHNLQASEQQAQGWTFTYSFDKKGRSSKVDANHSAHSENRYSYSFDYKCEQKKKASIEKKPQKNIKKIARKKQKLGTLYLSSNKKAKVFIDGKARGSLITNKRRQFRLRAGMHNVKVVRPKKTKKFKVKLNNNQTLAKRVKF